MVLSTLTAISPVDGRYRNKAENLAAYFSEYALIKYRVRVEIEYFITLSEFLPQLSELNAAEVKKGLRKIYQEFTEEDALRVKEIESVTNHDVKAVEYFIKEKTNHFLAEKYHEFIHFGLTSQDINNTSVPLSIKDALQEVYYPGLEEVIGALKKYAEEWMDIPMALLKAVPISAKFGGATGNFNAHHVAYPEYDWRAFGNKFVSEVLGLKREEWTTQISNYDNLAAIFDGLKRINTILIDLNRDFWQYISMEYFKQKIKAGEIGSSAMPHKVNPIDFENAEGNLGIANAILEHLATKLPVSRLQRDLTDSTVLRNVGVPLAHIEIAFKSLTKGLGKLLLNENALSRDLNNCWAVVAEGIQTVLRREGYPKPYEALKALTRTNQTVTEQSIKEFIETLNVSDRIKDELRAITPHNYTGI